jgi:hypothetical protein
MHVQGALEMVTATHQLVSSIYALGLCARPLLLAGLPPDPALGQEGPPSREAAAQALATAMMQMLPAIDVNDSAKTLVAIRFYMAVLSSVASLEVRRDIFCFACVCLRSVPSSIPSLQCGDAYTSLVPPLLPNWKCQNIL